MALFKNIPSRPLQGLEEIDELSCGLVGFCDRLLVDGGGGRWLAGNIDI